MADQTITSVTLGNGQVRYELGRANWAPPRIPNLHQSGTTTVVPANRLIDVIILGDGFIQESDFRAALTDWLRDFFTLKVYDVFAGAFRIRALYTSSSPASTARNSYYGCAVDATETELADGEWPSEEGATASRFRDRFWAAVDSFDGIEWRRYPSDLHNGHALAVSDAKQRDVYRNLVVVMLVRTASSDNVSGARKDVPRTPDEPARVRGAFGKNMIHEFSHAFGFLSDEYIDSRDSANDDRLNPATPSVLSCSNLSYSDLEGSVPWLHLAPTGRFPRAAGGSAPSPVAGWMWVGGVVHHGAWHSEYRCLMNGGHDNFVFTQDAASDPTPPPTGHDLRDRTRFCAWCQEIVVLRILERTDQFTSLSLSGDLTSLGCQWFSYWQQGLRENYYALFDVQRQITDAEADYAALRPGRTSEPLWQSDLYQVPVSPVPVPSVAPQGLNHEELYLLTS